MNDQAKADAQQRGYEVRLVSGYGDQWFQIYVNGNTVGPHYGVEAEAWEGVQEIINRDTYGIGS